MKRQSGLQIMKRLIVELGPLRAVMAVTITLGVLGFVAAITLTTMSAVAIGALIGEVTWISFKGALGVMLLMAILRGLLRYGEQLSGHYIAFRILATLRDKTFACLRKLAPAKLEGKNKGDIITMVTSDIELLEVFYAHTIAPISIAIITNMLITGILYYIHPYFGLLGGIFFLIVGLGIPYFSSAFAKEAGLTYRETFSQTNVLILDSLRGLREVLMYNNGQQRLQAVHESSLALNKSQERLKHHEGIVRALADLTIMVALLTFVGIGAHLMGQDSLSFSNYLIAVVLIASSFGPVVALSNLSNNLLQTFACAQRLFELLDELPQVSEIQGMSTCEHHTIAYEKVSFGYPGRTENLLENTNLRITKGERVALVGESGMGKSTLIKLLMRFWDVSTGEIRIDGEPITQMPTATLRKGQTLVSQETYLFNESILENIRLGNPKATRKEVAEAAKHASVHDFIMSLPEEYDSNVGELGGSVSSGEKQRIGLARAFLRKSAVLILDEPTSNLDTLNEAQILKAIKENSEEQTVLLVSHRQSTTAICDKVYTLKERQ
ncbi:MAG: amino acid ABC transporter ATP-binding/permease protein, partial [Cellulosilyticaceae bacterium]